MKKVNSYGTTAVLVIVCSFIGSIVGFKIAYKVIAPHIVDGLIGIELIVILTLSGILIGGYAGLELAKYFSREWGEQLEKYQVWLILGLLAFIIWMVVIAV